MNSISNVNHSVFAFNLNMDEIVSYIFLFNLFSYEKKLRNIFTLNLTLWLRFFRQIFLEGSRNIPIQENLLCQGFFFKFWIKKEEFKSEPSIGSRSSVNSHFSIINLNIQTLCNLQFSLKIEFDSLRLRFLNHP